ncbi:MAG: hypothetical protein M3N18_12040 [Actinomycetota bacterium]|nr:hypothetical protein [Actinomycetota bacterium]
MQQRQSVQDILLVEFHDLQLGEQQFRQRNRRGLHVEPFAEGDRVGHPEGADEDIHLPVVSLVEEQQPLPAVDRVKADLRRVAQSLEEPLSLGRRAFRRDPVGVPVLAPEHRKEAILRPQLDRYPAEQPEGRPPPFRLVGDAQGLLDHVGPDIAHAFNDTFRPPLLPVL